MIYSFSDTIPAQTAKANARKIDIKLARGIIHKIEVDFPAGCQKLAHVSIWSGGHQMWPSNPDADFAAEDYVISFGEYFETKTGQNWWLKTWNTDDTYSHEVTVRFGILPEWAVAISKPLTTLTNILNRLLGIRE